MILFAPIAVLAQLATQTPTCPPILPTCIPQTPMPTWTPIKTPTHAGPTATRTRTPTPFRTSTPGSPTLTPTITPTPNYSFCLPPCDQFEVMYDYKGSFVPSVTGTYNPPQTYPNNTAVFVLPYPLWIEAHSRTVVVAYRLHNSAGWTMTLYPVTLQPLGPNPYANWIEAFYHDGITGGCQATPQLLYCPQNDVTRQQVAIMLEKVLHGDAYVPPPCTGIFADVPCATPTPTVTVTP